jgi:hypothetical protein
MLSEKAVTVLSTVRYRMATALSRLAALVAPADYRCPVATVDTHVSGPEDDAVFVPSSKYADYVRCVSGSDRGYPDSHYSSRIRH